MRALLLAGVAAIGWSSAAQASYTLTLSQVGPDIIANGAGSLNIGLAQPIILNSETSFVAPSKGDILIGEPFIVTAAYAIIATSPFPTNFGSGTSMLTQGIPASGDGPLVGVFSGTASMADLALPYQYVSGTSLSSTAIFSNVTFASAGLTEGAYTYAFSSDTFTVDIGTTAGTPVPEPASLALLALPLGVAGVIVVRRRRDTTAA